MKRARGGREEHAALEKMTEATTLQVAFDGKVALEGADDTFKETRRRRCLDQSGQLGDAV